MKRRSLVQLSGAAAATLALPTLRAQARQKVTLMLNWYTYSEHAPFYFGKDRGLYEAEGIDLDIQEGRGSGPTVQAVAAGSVNFGYADTGALVRAVVRGAPLRSIGVMLQTSPMAVISLEEKNIRKPEDIRGKTIATTPGDALSQIWPLFLRKTGIRENEFRTVAGDGQTKLNAVINGQADALLGFLMDQGIRVTDATKKPTTYIPFHQYGVNLLATGFIANRDTLQRTPDLATRFMRATTRAALQTERTPEAAVDAMLKINPKSGQRDSLITGLKLTIPLWRTPETRGLQPFQLSMKNANDTLDMLVQFGGLEASQRGRAEDYFTLTHLPT